MQHNDMSLKRRRPPSESISLEIQNAYPEKFTDILIDLEFRLSLRHTIECKRILDSNAEFKNYFFSLRGELGLKQAVEIIKRSYRGNDHDNGNFINYYLSNLNMDLDFIRLIEATLDEIAKSSRFKTDLERCNRVKAYLRKHAKTVPPIEHQETFFSANSQKQESQTNTAAELSAGNSLNL